MKAEFGFSKANNYILPTIAFLDSFSGIVVGVGGLLLIRSRSSSLLVNGAMSSFSSIGLIICTLFIGAKLDDVNKRNSLIIFNLLMFIALQFPFWANNKWFLTLFIGADLFVSLFSLIESLSYSGSIKQLVSDHDVEKVVNWNSSFGMLGTAIGTITIASLTLITKSYRDYLPVASIACLLNALLSMGLVQNKEFVQTPKNFSTLKHIKKVALSIRNNKGLRTSIIFSIVFSMVQGSFNSLLIYYWNSVDPDYSKIVYLIVSYLVGIPLGIYLIRYERKPKLMTAMVLSLFFTFLIMDLNPSVPIMCVCIVMVLVVTLPMSNLARKVRIKGTKYDVQSSQESFVSFGSAICDVLVTTVLAGLAQLMGNAGIVLVLVGIVAAVVMLAGEKTVYNYDKKYNIDKEYNVD